MDNHFELEGSLVEDDISSWYTWDYLARKELVLTNYNKLRLL